MQQGKVIQLRAKEKLAQTKYLLEESRNIAIKYLPALLQRMLDNADDILFELADKADNNQEQNTYFDAMRELRRTRKSLESGFKLHLNTSFDEFSQPPLDNLNNSSPAIETGFDEMSLLDEIDLEESLAINGMVSKIRSRYPRELYAIEKRFSKISSIDKQDIDLIPIGPKSICHAFDEAVRSLNTDIKIKLIIYKLFDKHVLSNLQALYDETNVLFISAGILPKLKMQVEKQPGSSHHNQARVEEASWLDNSSVSPTQNSLDNGAGYRESSHPPSTLNTLQSLLHAQGLEGFHSSKQASLEHATRNINTEVIELLSNLQQLNLTTSTEAFHNELSSLKSVGKISTVDNDIINIIDMLFDFILDDDNLPTIAKALLARLQIPMIKIALVDSDFFASKEHPAKKLLNQMAKSAAGLSNDITSESCPLIQKIEDSVNSICTGFKDDPGIFEQLLSEFEQFIQADSEREQELQETSKKRIEQREQQALSRTWVTDVIASTIQNKHLPKAVFELIDGPWKEVMINTYLDDGENSEHWKENLRFIDVLIWSTETNNGKVDRQRLGKLIPQLVNTLHKELEVIYYPPAKLDTLLANLEALHIASLRGENSKLKTVRVKADASEAGQSSNTQEDIENELAAMRNSLAEAGDINDLLGDVFSDINPDKDNAEIARKKAIVSELFESDIEEIVMTSTPDNDKTIPEIDDCYWAMVQELSTGQWISLTDSNGKTQKIKLAWKSGMLGECTFINWKFKVAADFSFNQLAAKFRSGQAALVDNLPIFERAIDAVVNTLQKSHTSPA